MKAFAAGCVRVYLILKEKAAQFNADPEIQGLLGEVKSDDGSMGQYLGPYTADKALAPKAHTFDRRALGRRVPPYEKLYQLTVELLFGV